MSLIDDALKRAQAAGEGAPGKPGERPWIPTPMPDAGLARRRRLARWFALGVMAAAFVAAGVILVGRTGSRRPPLPAGEGRGEGRPALAPPPATPTPEEIEVTTPVAVARARPTRPPRPAAETSAGEVSPAPAAPAPAAPGRLAAGKTYVGSVNLPGGAKIELGGIVWSETEPRALLNDRVVATGAYVEGFGVAKIEENRVALEKDGVTIYLSVK